MARWEGVEPPTFWFVARCSIQLSYQRGEGRIIEACAAISNPLNTPIGANLTPNGPNYP